MGVSLLFNEFYRHGCNATDTERTFITLVLKIFHFVFG